MKEQIYRIGFIIFLFSFLGCQNESKKIENMVTFAKVYGYVKYFHPSDEASQIDWEKFSIYGASQIDQCRTKEDIVNTLNRLFKPIAPSITFAEDKTILDTDLKDIIPENKEQYAPVYWQHVGVSIGMDSKRSPYASWRINRDSAMGIRQLFEYEPELGESVIKQVGDGIYCRIPIVLYGNNESTFPRADETRLEELKEKLKDTNNAKVEDPYLRLGNMVNVFNVFQHFYPYFDVVEVDWEAEFKNAIEQSYIDTSKFDHLVTLRKFTATLQDGHISVSNKSLTKDYAPSIAWEWIENKLVVTKVAEYYDSIHVGDIVTHIDGKSSEEHFEETYSRISAATDGWLRYKARTQSLIGQEGSELNVVIEGKEHKLKRTAKPSYWLQKARFEKDVYKEIEPDIWYLNLDQIAMDTINKLLPQLEECKSIICDLRGYPKGNHGFIRHLLAIDDTTSAWMQRPKIVYPDQNKVVGHYKSNWIGSMTAKKPYLGDKNVVFITNGRAISYAESYMGYIEGYKLATIVGQPTAGTNGNVNLFSLPGGYKISWTGMKVVKHDGTQHHGIGVLPNIYVEKTIQGVKEGRDELLEKALEVARGKNE